MRLALRTTVKGRELPLPSGKFTKSYWKLPIEIVDLTIQNGDVPLFFVCWPGRVFSNGQLRGSPVMLIEPAETVC